jgi:hypothetical protein
VPGFFGVPAFRCDESDWVRHGANPSASMHRCPVKGVVSRVTIRLTSVCHYAIFPERFVDSAAQVGRSEATGLTPVGSFLARTWPVAPHLYLLHRGPHYSSLSVSCHNFHLIDFLLRKAAGLAHLQELLSVNAAEHLDQFCDEAGPSGLVACSQTRAIIAVEVLEE